MHLNGVMHSEAATAREPVTSPLGPVLRIHTARRSLLLRDRIVMAFSALVAGSAFVFGIWRWYDAYQHYGPALVSRWTTPFLAASGAAALLFLAALIEAGRKRRFRVAVCEQGLILQNGRKQLGIRWSGIQALHIQATHYLVPTLNHQPPLRLSLHVSGQKPITLPSSLEDVDTLIEVIKAHTYPGLLEGYRQRLDQGLELLFGPLSISNTSLCIGKTAFYWEDIQRTWLEQGQLCIEVGKGGRTNVRRIPARLIPNVDLCTQILHHLGQAL